MINHVLKTVLSALNLSPAAVSTVPESYSSEVYRLTLSGGKIVILKIPFNRQKLYREREIMKRLQGHAPVPRVLDFWEGNETITGALLLSLLPGEPLSRRSDIITLDQAQAIGELAAKMHSVKTERFGQLECNPHPGDPVGWWEWVRCNFERFRADCKRVLPQETMERCLDRFNRFYEDLPPADGPCIIHFDFRAGNILADEQGSIIGVIDFESSRGGSADQDFTKISYDVWDNFPGTKEAFLRGYASIRPVPPFFERTLPIYLFIDAFGGISWCARRGQVGMEHEFYRFNWERLESYLKSA